MHWLIVVCAFAILFPSEARQLSKCELVRELRKHGFLENQIRDWVCLVEHESGRRTDVIGKKNRDGSWDYGLFQINDKYWCSNSANPGKDCNVTCKQLLSDDISKAATCAKKIYQRHGFDAWYAWRDYCRGKPLPDISTCN